ncbi:YgiT-type zinc finger protein [Cyanobacterium sp. IPPAS B-1200]|uniref:YgiT-type zinc finger protein n=1 Tax=Cyanobacterium sp. IPPAS B-1200 TaxID=1562720 RepID=UPI000852768B|nr:YgiT-type zinc finger protein [Cyanobacterium sp. IPPAS B-1200]OEJ79977.1 YgiT-type zinc finger domain-containing protein [Cyanobacterium sp. IPPAS B-1200]
MDQCHVCNANSWENKLINQTFDLDGKLVVVENIPAQICSCCGEIIFSAETAENIRLMLNNNPSPQHSIMVDVFAFSS